MEQQGRRESKKSSSLLKEISVCSGISAKIIAAATSSSTCKEAQDEDICSICLTTVQTDNQAQTIPCKHIFHFECADRWSMEKVTCAFCRQKVKEIIHVSQGNRVVKNVQFPVHHDSDEEDFEDDDFDHIQDYELLQGELRYSRNSSGSEFSIDMDATTVRISETDNDISDISAFNINEDLDISSGPSEEEYSIEVDNDEPIELSDSQDDEQVDPSANDSVFIIENEQEN